MMVVPSSNDGIHERSGQNYDRNSELQAFDDTKAGVKGLVDAGITKVPRIFHHPPQNISDIRTPTGIQFDFPVIDIQSFDEDPSTRREGVDRIREAAATWGFFQVVNHGIPATILNEMLNGVREFMEQDEEIRKQFYTRDLNKKFRFNSSFDLFTAQSANWRDSFYTVFAPNHPQPEELPQIFREIMIEYSKQVMEFGKSLFELLSEALGLNSDHLLKMECVDTFSLLGHYYPPCPEPELTLGTTNHSDGGFVTVLLQDNIGGLQVMHRNQWVDVPPLPGALVINIGDLLQLITNDKFISVEHRVVASQAGPRLSVAGFFGVDSGPSSIVYEPIKELLSEDNRAKYRAATAREYGEYFRKKGLNGTSALLHFQLKDYNI